jgi:hypothetical protein
MYRNALHSDGSIVFWGGGVTDINENYSMQKNSLEILQYHYWRTTKIERLGSEINV